MSDQEPVQTTTATPVMRTSACRHPEAVGMRWGDPISEERQEKLQGYLDKWEAETDHGARMGPFDGVQLNGADAGWLAERSGREAFTLTGLYGTDAAWVEANFGRSEGTQVPNLHLEGALLLGAHLEGAVLSGAHLSGADVQKAHLEDAILFDTDLKRATLDGAHLAGANLSRANLERADLDHVQLTGAELDSARLVEASLSWANLADAHLSWANLADAHLGWANLTGADLHYAHLERATLREACLTGTDLHQAHLERANCQGVNMEGSDLRDAYLQNATLNAGHLAGAVLTGAHLEGADLRGGWMDKATKLNNATFEGASLDQLSFDGANLAVIKWEAVALLGDEVRAHTSTDDIGEPKDQLARLNEYEAAIRAYLQLAAVIRSQGMSEHADRFTYRAQNLQRQRYRLQQHFGQWLFSWLLFLMAGYGYRLGRIVVAYALIVGVFAAAFLASDVVSGQAALTVPNAFDALQISLNAVHGRVFFAQFHLDTLQSWLATTESIVGIVIEGVFIAMLIQRFFGR